VIFRHPKVVDFLLKNGIMATMRNYKYEVNRRVLIRTPKGVFYGSIIDVVPNTPENRLRFYRISCFDNPDEWLLEAEMVQFCSTLVSMMTNACLGSLCRMNRKVSSVNAF